MEQPPLIESTPAPPVLEKKRYHDLDALRACAMLLGIVLHGILAFGEPGWSGYAPQNDIHWDVPAVVGNAAAVVGAEAPEKFSPYNVCFAAIHGFRMPLFFVVSGFFTVMLWRNRGIKELLKHRAKRILLPMMIFTPIAWITILGGMGIGALGAKILFGDEGDSKGKIERSGNSITDAVVAGDLDAVKGHLSRGADINQRNEKGETLLHIAAFLAHPEVVQFLLDKGVDPTIKSKKGQTALNYVEIPWNKEIEGTYKFVGGLLRLELDLERIERDRPKCAVILRKQGTSGSRSPPPVEDTELEGPLKKFKYRVYYQRFTSLPDFDKLTPEFSGESEKGIIDLGLARREETFGMVFEGELEIKEAGDFKFRLGSDDGSRLIINGKELIDNDGMHAVKYKEESIELEPGMAQVRVEYFDSGGAQGLSLSVSGPGIKELSVGKDELLLSKEGGMEGGEEFMRDVKTWVDENLGEVPG
ncbi:MAG: acyltransferase family protein, partial [Dehalococcoidia bacterium]|nr:acyltransferase family protein [Dehalococcoidia bacterium]